MDPPVRRPRPAAVGTTRRRRSGRHDGPYTSARTVRAVLDAALATTGLRSCGPAEFRRAVVSRVRACSPDRQVHRPLPRRPDRSHGARHHGRHRPPRRGGDGSDGAAHWRRRGRMGQGSGRRRPPRGMPGSTRPRPCSATGSLPSTSSPTISPPSPRPTAGRLGAGGRRDHRPGPHPDGPRGGQQQPWDKRQEGAGGDAHVPGHGALRSPVVVAGEKPTGAPFFGVVPNGPVRAGRQRRRSRRRVSSRPEVPDRARVRHTSRTRGAGTPRPQSTLRTSR